MGTYTDVVVNVLLEAFTNCRLSFIVSITSSIAFTINIRIILHPVNFTQARLPTRLLHTRNSFQHHSMKHNS